MQAGLDPRRDGGAALVHHVDRQAVGGEQRTDLRRQLEDDLVDVLGRMDPVGDRLQPLEEGQPAGDVPDAGPAARRLLMDLVESPMTATAGRQAQLMR